MLSLSVGCAAAPSNDLVYRVPGMEQVIVRSNLIYNAPGAPALRADVYLPKGVASNATLPGIIFIMGDASPEILQNAKDWKIFQSYGRLAAASGYVGVTFNHRSHETFTKLSDVRSDIEALLRYVRANASVLSMDKDRLCLWFLSGSGPHLSVGMGTNASFVKCLVAYYPVLAVPTNRVNAVEAAEFSSITQLRLLAPRVPPLLLAKAGRDAPSLNRVIDAFRAQANASASPLEFLEHPKGRHAFDLLDDDETSRAILRRTMSFIERHLRALPNGVSNQTEPAK